MYKLNDSLLAKFSFDFSFKIDFGLKFSYPITSVNKNKKNGLAIINYH